MLGLANVLTTWSRAVFDPQSGATIPNRITLRNIPTHADVIPSTSFHELPSSARKSTYVLMVDAGTDVVTGDFMEACVDVLTGADWPSDYPSDVSQAGWQNTIWVVRFHHESASGAGAYRALYVEKTQTGGPASPY